jgi:hypothetical protein
VNYVNGTKSIWKRLNGCKNKCNDSNKILMIQKQNYLNSTRLIRRMIHLPWLRNNIYYDKSNMFDYVFFVFVLCIYMYIRWFLFSCIDMYIRWFFFSCIDMYIRCFSFLLSICLLDAFSFLYWYEKYILKRRNKIEIVITDIRTNNIPLLFDYLRYGGEWQESPYS